MKQNLLKVLEREIDIFTAIAGDFNIFLSVIDRKSNRKLIGVEKT